ncbi:50S ribosomal protein L30 [Candidatus Fermentibacterales bacterium]|nr:50S ribosomal protein L30 [Candidatus Fermentibacterales bacterium]
MPRKSTRSPGTLRVTQRKSAIGSKQNQKRTLKAMGLGRVDQVAELPDLPQTRGMIFRVRHLVEVEEAGK